MKKKLISSLLAISMLASMSTTAFANLVPESNYIDAPNGSSSVPVELNVTPLSFSVTVPSVLPITVNGNGEVSVATNTKIVNNSQGKVEIKDLTITTGGAWSLVPMTDDFANKSVNTKDFGMSFNGADAATEELESTFAVINANAEQAFTYAAKLAPQSEEIVSEQIASAVFTIGWSTFKKPMFTMVHKPSGETNVVTDGFYVSGRDVTPYDGENYNYITFNSNEYYAKVGNVSVPITSMIPQDFWAVDYGELGLVSLSREFLGKTAGELAEYSVDVIWPSGYMLSKTGNNFSMLTFAINGEEISVPTLSYTHYNNNGDIVNVTSPHTLWILDEDTKTFTLGTADTVLTENMIFYTDSHNILWNTVVGN